MGGKRRFKQGGEGPLPAVSRKKGSWGRREGGVTKNCKKHGRIGGKAERK